MNYINGSELANKRFIKLENGDYREVLKGKFIPKDGEQYYFLNIYGYINLATCSSYDSRDKRVMKSKERGEAFVDAVGEEAVERYMFNYWR